MKLLLRVVILAALILGGTSLVVRIDRDLEMYNTRSQERAVAALPGVGQGWLDTLRIVAGDVAQIDTITALEAYDDGPGLLGIFEPWHGIISINVDMPAYADFQRRVCNRAPSFEYVHPVTLATPAAVVAHEFGHRFQFGLWPSGIPGLVSDSLPTYAQDFDERFADRFSHAMMALRGWDTPDSTDKLLNHIVRFKLMQALAR